MLFDTSNAGINSKAQLMNDHSRILPPLCQHSKGGGGGDGDHHTSSPEKPKKRRRQGLVAAAADPQDLVYAVNEDADVILGREKLNAWQPGNIRFVRLVESRKAEYSQASTGRAQKSAILQEIYRSIVHARPNPGRFLTRHPTIKGAFVILQETTVSLPIQCFIRQSI